MKNNKKRKTEGRTKSEDKDKENRIRQQRVKLLFSPKTLKFLSVGQLSSGWVHSNYISLELPSCCHFLTVECCPLSSGSPDLPFTLYPSHTHLHAWSKKHVFVIENLPTDPMVWQWLWSGKNPQLQQFKKKRRKKSVGQGLMNHEVPSD